tara:strand:+ start:855 stop:992 length:138 start_codon:yes stop_codon:yes gene_type:complete
VALLQYLPISESRFNTLLLPEAVAVAEFMVAVVVQVDIEIARLAN